MKIIEECDTIFYIGQNDKDNTELFDKMKDDAIWVHLNDLPSAHVYFELNSEAEKIDKRLKMKLIKIAGRLVKENSKFKNIQKLSICYTKKKNLKKGKALGEVILNVEPGIIKI